MQTTDLSISQSINQQMRIDRLLCTKTAQEEEQVQSAAQLSCGCRVLSRASSLPLRCPELSGDLSKIQSLIQEVRPGARDSSLLTSWSEDQLRVAKGRTALKQLLAGVGCSEVVANLPRDLGQIALPFKKLPCTTPPRVPLMPTPGEWCSTQPARAYAEPPHGLG